MTVHPVSKVEAQPTGDVLLDGLFTGMIGALAVAIWFLALDAFGGHPLYTPALLGTVLLHGSTAASQTITVAPLEIAAYTAFHFVVFAAVGLLLSYLMTLFERFPIMFFVLLVLFLCLQVGFFGLNAALGASLLGRLQAWTVVVANLLAAGSMVLYQWRRHPSVVRGIERLWEHEPD
ncbi:MAG TPA: hypothetical protein VL332_03255 [Candidatus Saccharimonadaceae bacterium]|nr:hypothetical protein [Candidatus Saccharimonadaceae bacterium]